MKSKTSCIIAALMAGMALAQPAFAYTQDYVTYWETENVGGGRAWYNFLVANTGSADYSSNTTTVPDGRGGFISTTNVHNEIPLITTYTLPILTAASWATVNQSTIYQPDGWAWRLADPTPANWKNTTGNTKFDHPYKVLEWYVTDKNAPADHVYDWNYRYGLAPQFSRDEVQNWASQSPDNDPVEFFHGEYLDENGNTAWRGEAIIWHEAVGPAFGFLAYSGKTLSPDQTGWDLAVQDYSYTTTWTPLPPRIGDPDDPLKSSGVGAIALPTAPVPEPESYALFLAGLGMMAFIARRRRSE